MSIALHPIARSGFGRAPIYGQDSLSSASSSIGNNSESWGTDGQDSSGEKEVESPYKGPIGALDSLEEALPIRRGLSSCYQGKSKSFTSLLDATASGKSSKDFVKPENSYTRRKRNEIAKKLYFLKPGISKRQNSTNRSTLALAVSMSNTSQPRHHLLPPLHPSSKNSANHSSVASSPPRHCSFSTRSFSLTDLEGFKASGSSVGVKEKFTRFSDSWI